MSSILKVDEIQDTSGNNIINENADTITIGASGDTVNVVGTLQNGGTNFLQGITEADQWRITTATAAGGNGAVSTNWERNDSNGYGSIGTGMTESSGVFTLPSTGIYLIIATIRIQVDASDTSASVNLMITENNSTFNETARMSGGNGSGTAQVQTATNMFLFDVTDTTTHKFRMDRDGFGAGTFLAGNTGYQATGFTVLRLGDT
jgi:hypothetical protein